MWLIVRSIRRLHAVLGALVTRLALLNAGTAPGPRTRFLGFVYFREPSAVRIGAHCLIGRHVEGGAELPGARLNIGDGVQINDNVLLDHTGDLTLEEGCLISAGAILYTHDHGHDPRSTPTPIAKTIGANAWVGLRAIVLPGCRRVGKHAVIGAGSVVTKDVPDFAIVAGNPAVIIGQVNAATRQMDPPARSA